MVGVIGIEHVTRFLTSYKKIILNMTEFVNNKKDKLSLTQLDVCKSI
jgi:hypothetical protein